MKEFINSDLKDYNKHKDLVDLRRNFFNFQSKIFSLKSFKNLLDLKMSEIIINEKTHIELPVYLSIEHNILRNREYRRCFEYIEELINRNVNFIFNLSVRV